MDKTKQSIASKSEYGQSLVEVTVSLILILTLLAGAVDFGIALYSYVAIRDAAQEGALYASIDPTNISEIQERVFSSSSSPVDLRNKTTVAVDVIPAGATACEGNGAMIQVQVTYSYQLIMPILPGILGITEIPLSASVTGAILQPACP
ncbi:MAG: pilus assembly protein [Anaerolineales bacterium]|nr:pilus assembly protein [Anaerolineales bacterium]